MRKAIALTALIIFIAAPIDTHQALASEPAHTASAAEIIFTDFPLPRCERCSLPFNDCICFLPPPPPPPPNWCGCWEGAATGVCISYTPLPLPLCCVNCAEKVELLREISTGVNQSVFQHWTLALTAFQAGLLVALIIAVVWGRR